MMKFVARTFKVIPSCQLRMILIPLEARHVATTEIDNVIALLRENDTERRFARTVLIKRITQRAHYDAALFLLSFKATGASTMPLSTFSWPMK